MTVRLRKEQSCVTEGCLRPARELGDLCTRCWQGLTPSERHHLQWLATATESERSVALHVAFDEYYERREAERRNAAQDTDEIDVAAVLRALGEAA